MTTNLCTKIKAHDDKIAAVENFVLLPINYWLELAYFGLGSF